MTAEQVTTTSESTTAADPVALLDGAMRRAIRSSLGEAFADVDPLIKPSQNREFGDFQANVAMPLAKRVGKNPREIAQQLASAVASEIAPIAERPDVAGPGFINIRLKPAALSGLVEQMHERDLGVTPETDRHAVVIDMCSVNVAKQMHVGHLRSTIIGDALGRVMERLGRTVHRQNHLGDWGLQIGMVLHQLRAAGVDLDRLSIAELERAYRDAQLACKADESGLEAARRLHAGPHRIAELEEQNAGAQATLRDVKQTLVRLQRGDEELIRDWRKLIDVTMRAVYEIIDLLNVKLDRSSERGESFYRDKLADVVEEFQREGAAREDQGAVVVPFEDRERPLLIQKSDGGFLYATTDLAAIRYRVRELEADRIIYVVDARQRDHFRDVFDAVRKVGWNIAPDEAEVELTHIAFGAVLGEDKRPLKTRSGENVTLKALLEEAVQRGTAEVKKRAADPMAPTHGLDDDELAKIGRAVGIGAVKYADLSSELTRDYVFNFDRMIAFEGNTGPYIQYAHARICSIFAKAGEADAAIRSAPIAIAEPAEKDLALLLLRYNATVHAVSEALEPHRLCTYLYDLANAYSAFYQSCPVIKADDEATRRSRLRLCAITRDLIADGLALLGIDAPTRM